MGNVISSTCKQNSVVTKSSLSFVLISFTILSILSEGGDSSHGFGANVLNCNTVVSEFKMQWCYLRSFFQLMPKKKV